MFWLLFAGEDDFVARTNGRIEYLDHWALGELTLSPEVEGTITDHQALDHRLEQELESGHKLE